jgi:hypothetical protein
MGVTAGLISFPTEIFDRVKAAGTFYPPNGGDIQQCQLSRSWDELHPALRSFGPRLSLSLSGDYGLDGGLNRFGWDDANQSDHYVGFVSPPLVAGIAAQLRALTFQQFAATMTAPSREAEYVAQYFQEIVAFYTAAAAGGHCVFIHVA